MEVESDTLYSDETESIATLDESSEEGDGDSSDTSYESDGAETTVTESSMSEGSDDSALSADDDSDESHDDSEASEMEIFEQVPLALVVFDAMINHSGER